MGITDNDDSELCQYFYHADHLGSASYITNLDGEIAQHIEYVPFGEVFLEEKNNKWNSPYLFNGKERDEETGLSYYGARYYDSRVSQWLSVDPLAEKFANRSPYEYVFSNPIVYNDPTGMEGEKADDIIYLNNDGTVNSVEETDDDFNVFVMKETSQVVHLNDKDGLDKEKYTNDDFQKGDRVFFSISDDKLQEMIDGAGKGEWYNLIYKSHGEADFTMSELVPNYFGKDGTGNEKVYLENGVLRTHYEENYHYFKFGDDYQMYNLYDAGNFIWGAWMGNSGFEYSTIKIGSELNEGFNDAKADQHAIRRGYFHSKNIK